MAHHDGLNRRSFLSHCGDDSCCRRRIRRQLRSPRRSPAVAAADAMVNGPFDFDTPFNRIGTDCTRWDAQIRIYGKDKHPGRDGHRRHGLPRCARDHQGTRTSGCSTRTGAISNGRRRSTQAVINWNKKRYGLTINPESLVITTGVHPGLVAAMQAFCPRGSKILINSPVYNGFFGDFRFTGITPEQNPLKLVDGRFSIDFDDFERRISRGHQRVSPLQPAEPDR